MIDFIFEQLGKIFDYFFAVNAPMTIIVLGLTGGLFYYLKSREASIVRPLEIANHQAILLKKQMDNAENPLDELRSKFYGLYRHQRRLGLEKSGMTVDEARFQLDADKDTFLHSLQLRGVHGALRNEIRAYFRENHLADKSEAEFENYIEKRKKQVWTVVVNAMNDYWFPGMIDPSRSDMFDVHEESRDSLLRIVEEIFREGRRIAQDYRAEIASKESRRWLSLRGIF